jgi:pimeloyl-ACP methyl ester carboxylesterase
MLLALLDRVGTAHVVGHSYGGLLALKVALARPVRSLSLFEPVAFSVLDRVADADAWGVLEKLPMHYNLAAPDRVDESWIAAFVEWWNGPGAYGTLNADARNAFRATGWKVFQEVVSINGDATPPQAYRALDAPVLLMGGARSPLPAGRVLERLEALLPNARRHVLDGVGHMAPVSAAEVVNREIVEHIQMTAG